VYGFSDQLKPMPFTRFNAPRQGSSRYSTFKQVSIEHMFASLQDGISRLTLPLPTGPKHVHCYLVDGTLFDTGLGLSGTDWSGHGIERIAITHFHPDHVGGARDAAEATGARVYQGALDYEQTLHVWGTADWPARMVAWFVRHGVPGDVTEELIERGHAFAPFVRFARDPELLREGDEVDGWRVVALPGHADGHIGFLRDGVLVGGDHVLNRISPAIGLYPDSRPDPLGDYLDSLRRTIELAPRLVLTGHGEPVEDAAARATELLAHHDRRLDQAFSALSDRPQTGFELSYALFGDTLGPTQRRFAVAETLSHLERLVLSGRARHADDDGVVGYSAA
jgi:glyoxylase-like metal-dependent hydrolase (beta-lactamase superfamily II)